MLVKSSLKIAAVFFILVGTTNVGATMMSHGRSIVMTKLDVDHDGGQLDMHDIMGSAEAKFAQLDVDRDAKLDPTELTGIMTHAELVAADADTDGVLDKADYMGYVKRSFADADADRDGKLDAADLSSKAGVKLVTLLRY